MTKLSLLIFIVIITKFLILIFISEVIKLLCHILTKTKK